MQPLRRSTSLVLIALALAFGTFFAPVNAANDLTVDKITVTGTANFPTIGINASNQITIPTENGTTLLTTASTSVIHKAVANITQTSKTAGITTTSIVASPTTAGIYRILYYLVVTSTGTSTDMKATFGWTDPSTAARTLDSATVSCAATNYTQGTFGLVTSGASVPITYGTSLTGSCTYDLYITTEKL